MSSTRDTAFKVIHQCCAILGLLLSQLVFDHRKLVYEMWRLQRRTLKSSDNVVMQAMDISHVLRKEAAGRQHKARRTSENESILQ